MTAVNLPGITIRRWYVYNEETLTNEAGVPTEDAARVRKVVVGALLKNPAAGKASPRTHGRHDRQLRCIG